MSAERDAHTIVDTFDQALTSCSKLIEASDCSYSEQSINELVNLLNSISDSLISAPEQENEDSENVAIEILTRLHQHIALPSLKQEVIDALAFELPKAVARFACVSSRCLELAENVVDRFVERCSPRDMLSILCEALGSTTELFMVPGYFIPLLGGLIKVLVLIQRRHYEQVKTAVPVILNALETISSKSDDEDPEYEKLFHKAIGVANSIREVCLKLGAKDSEKLRALLSLYVLQIMVENSCESDILALVSVGMTSDILRCLPVVLELSGFLQHCELSYIGLITGFEVNLVLKLVPGDDCDDGMLCFSRVKLGAAIGVIWGYKTSEVAEAAKADLTVVIKKLQGNWTRRWEAIGMLKYIFSCANLPWELKKHAIRFLLCIMDGIVSHSYNDHGDLSMHVSTLYTSLQAIEMVIMYASDSELRRNAFSAFKKVLADIPTSIRFDVLRALIGNSDSSSMIGLLVDIVKEEMLLERTERNNSSPNAVLNSDVIRYASFWNPPVLELMEVLSALNLYRFILITESTGNSNHTGILCKDKLQKAYNEWLLPLRTLVTGTIAQNQRGDYDTSDMICALNPVELVLYRCIELVEEKLKHL
ncbi:hypothetical protein BUALT_Bualt14G0001100 [Buddleja alternifolia]|uniref:Aberrant root formation protein 4 n=1 Tax=Buddleja alternifolia TaxID=168488 RepID=A0AAV6WH01_9LAMI|nr:hypothetical protein BUALT_Bualt14G0001100 [Buddleja alternifolia]